MRCIFWVRGDGERGAQLCGVTDRNFSCHLQEEKLVKRKSVWCLGCFLWTDWFRNLLSHWLKKTMDYWLCNRSSLQQRKLLSQSLLPFLWEAKIPCLVRSSTVYIVYNNSICVMGNDREQKVGRLFSCIGERSPLDLFRGQDILINF